MGKGHFKDLLTAWKPRGTVGHSTAAATRVLWALGIAGGVDYKEARQHLTSKSNPSERLVALGHRRGPAAGSGSLAASQLTRY